MPPFGSGAGYDYNDNKELPYPQETTYYSGEMLRTFNLMPTPNPNYELLPTKVFSKRPNPIKTTTKTSPTTITTTTEPTTMTTILATKKTSLKFKPKTKLKSTTTTTTRPNSPISKSSQATTASLTLENKYSLIVSSFLEKLHNLESQATAKPSQAVDLTKQNYTILTATGKKTVLVPVDKPKFDLNETIVERLNYLAEIYSKKINNTKLMNQLEIIKNIFALKNRETQATTPPQPATATTTARTTPRTTFSSSTFRTSINEEYHTSSSEDDMTKQFDAYFDNLETSTLLQTVKNGNLKENLDSYYDESYEDSLENEDLSILDSDLLLNLQLNTFSTDPSKVNPKILAPPSHDLASHHLKGNDEIDESPMSEEEEGGESSEIVLNASASNQNSLKSFSTKLISHKVAANIYFFTYLVYVYYCY
jgi:hypothetical protein